ncbi:MAG: zinc ABC transporter substrate-binding protein [Clostridia bacterium]|nr:zinc ABC transporter substrate-binding protein [Clostridia bacterium]
MKKTVSCMLVFVMLFAFTFAGVSCAEAKKIHVVTTIFPVYDWVRQVVGDRDNVEITMLLDDGVDLHSYQPTAADMMKVATCDLFVYVGGESDDWVEDAFSESVNPEMKVVNLVKAMGDDIKTEEIVEGMEHEHEHDEDEDEHEHEEEHDHEHEAEADEHVWLSLRNARKLVMAITDALAEADPANAESYQGNAAAYDGLLSGLDAEYAAVREAADFDTVLFGDRFPFRYLVDDYGLNYYAAFSGCSAESEASFETVVFLAGKVDELGLTTVLTIEGDNHRIAETIVGNTRTKDAKVLSLDSLQATTGEDVRNGVTYLGVMEANLEVLRQALTK